MLRRRSAFSLSSPSGEGKARLLLADAPLWILDEPVTGERRVLVTVGADRVAADPGRLAALRGLVAREHPDAGTIVLRLPPGAAAPAGARLLMQYVESDTPLDPPADPAGWTVRPYRAEDRAAVHDLLVRALETGYDTAGAAAPRQRRRNFSAAVFPCSTVASETGSVSPSATRADRATIVIS